jgi:hypothetical protein
MPIKTLLVASLSIAFMFFPSITLAQPPASPEPPQDTLRIKGIAGADHVVVMIHSERESETGCANLILRSEEPISDGETLVKLGNRLSSRTCNARSELVIFSEGNAVYFGNPAWTDDPGDVHTATLEPLIKLPVTIWIAMKEAATRAEQDIERANLLYRKNKAGIQFVAEFRNDIVQDREAVATILAGISSFEEGICVDGLTPLQESPYYTANRLNVYYVDVDIAGRNCALMTTPQADDCMCIRVNSGNANITYIGRWARADNATLAHELAHALGLRPGPCGGHTFNNSGDSLPGFGRDNIMNQPAGIDRRTSFSLGQIFRMNIHKAEPPDMCGSSMLLENDPAIRPGRSCPPLRPGDMCPPLNANWP